MRVVLVDAFDPPDPAVIHALEIRGHDLTAVQSPREALELAHTNNIDCVLLDVATAGDCLGLAEMRLLARTSGIVLMSNKPVESLAAEAVARGSIEFRDVPAAVEEIERLNLPALIVARRFHRPLIKTLKTRGLRLSSASTLQFAMNLMADGWCQIVCLTVEIPGSTADNVAILHRISAREAAILASVLPESGIVFTEKLRKLQDFLSTIRRVAGDRPLPCGLVENMRADRRKEG